MQRQLKLILSVRKKTWKQTNRVVYIPKKSIIYLIQAIFSLCLSNKSRIGESNLQMKIRLVSFTIDLKEQKIYSFACYSYLSKFRLRRNRFFSFIYLTVFRAKLNSEERFVPIVICNKDVYFSSCVIALRGTIWKYFSVILLQTNSKETLFSKKIRRRYWIFLKRATVPGINSFLYNLYGLRQNDFFNISHKYWTT